MRLKVKKLTFILRDLADNMSVALITVDQCDLGIRSISRYLKKNNVKTKKILLNTCSYDRKVYKQLFRVLKDVKLIGISFRYVSIKRAYKLYKKLKELGIPIIVGGSSALSSPEFCLKYFDKVCVGDGEEVFLQSYKSVTKGKSLRNQMGLYVKTEKGVYRNKLFQNKNLLMKFDYDCDNDYMLINGWLRKISKPPLFYDDWGVFKKNSVFMLSHKGCVFECSYCIHSVLDSKSFVKVPIDELIEQLVCIKKRNPELEYIYLFDDDFFLRTTSEIKDFSEKYKRLVGLPFWVYGTPKSIDRVKLRLLISAGLKNISMGVQSGSDRTNLYVYNRKITQNEILKASRIISEEFSQINYPVYDILLNNPFEKTWDIMETIRLLKNIKPPFYIFCHNLVLFPGCKLYQKYVQQFGEECRSYQSMVHDYSATGKRVSNLYINSLLLWSQGLWTSNFRGIIPSFLFEIMLNRKFIKIMNSSPSSVSLINRLYLKILTTIYKFTDRRKAGLNLFP